MEASENDAPSMIKFVNTFCLRSRPGSPNVVRPLVCPFIADEPNDPNDPNDPNNFNLFFK